jgi:hypothetical protein
MTKILLLAIFAPVFILACKSNDDSSEKNVTDAGTAISDCSDVAGKRFDGLEGQGGDRSTCGGNEGCGIDGDLIFDSTTVRVSWPGDDTVADCDYASGTDNVRVDCGGIIRVLQFSDNCTKLSGDGATFTLQ